MRRRNRRCAPITNHPGRVGADCPVALKMILDFNTKGPVPNPAASGPMLTLIMLPTAMWIALDESGKR